MTANQIQFQKNAEERRHNRESEALQRQSNETAIRDVTEKERSNKANEIEANRSNLARETETKRHNVITENETMRNNMAVEKETNRHNVVGEIETERSHRANEQYNWANLAEVTRHNMASEDISRAGLKVNLRSAEMSSAAQMARASAAEYSAFLSNQAAMEANRLRESQISNDYEVALMNARTQARRADTEEYSAVNQQQYNLGNLTLGRESNQIRQQEVAVKGASTAVNAALQLVKLFAN